jgi:hypothetical protein
MTIFKTDSHDRAWDVANNYNKINGNTEEEIEMLENENTMGLTPNLYWATVYNDADEIIEPKFEEVNEMKKFTLENYQEFCDEALIMPPFEEDGDTETWFDNHKICISANDCVIELDYDADAVNEIDFALREIHEAILGSGEATTGNTFGSQYRPAELKDVVRWFIMYRYENWGGLNWFDYAKQAVEELKDIQSVIGIYEHAKKIEKDIEFKCDWHDFKLESLKDATEEGIKKIILDLVGSDIEISYDPHTDKSFIIDYTFKDSGDFIDWAWGNVNKEEQRVLLESYKTQIFEEVK